MGGLTGAEGTGRWAAAGGRGRLGALPGVDAAGVTLQKLPEGARGCLGILGGRSGFSEL